MTAPRRDHDAVREMAAEDVYNQAMLALDFYGDDPTNTSVEGRIHRLGGRAVAAERALAKWKRLARGMWWWVLLLTVLAAVNLIRGLL